MTTMVEGIASSVLNALHRGNVNYTGEMMFRTDSGVGYEHYNAYNEVVLVAGIYEVSSGPFKSPALKD